MKIILPNKKELRGDLVPLLILRTDLVAIPSTIEFLVRVDEELSEFIKQGEVISLTDEDRKYRIIFTQRKADGIMYQGNPDYQLTKVIAILESCHKLSYIAEKAIIKENTSLGTVYRACGATMAIDTDIKLDKFTCYKGDSPTYSIMKAIARTASAIVWDGKNKISFKRLQDLMKQDPAEILPVDVTQDVRSGFIERHEIPAFYSNEADGSIAKSNVKSGIRADYEMFADKQVLNNLSTYLVHRKIWTTPLIPSLNAGQIIKIAEENFVIITATHVLSKSDSGSGSQMSRFWLGALSRNVTQK